MKEFKVKVEVKLKPVVLDPQGKTILTALKNLGYEGIEDARVGKLIELKITEEDSNKVKEKVNDMCAKLLSNPVIEDFVVNVEE